MLEVEEGQDRSCYNICWGTPAHFKSVQFRVKVGGVVDQVNIMG